MKNRYWEHEIKLGEGIAFLKFGMTLDDVEGVLVQPTEIEEHEYGCGYVESIEYRYHDLGVELSFDVDEGKKLDSCQIYSNEYTLFSRGLIGCSKRELMEFGEEFQLGDWESQDTTTPSFSECNLVRFDDYSVTFWFRENKVHSILWGNLWIDDDTRQWCV